MVQCKAKSKQSQERCKRHAVPGKEVCVIHGGKSLSGPDSGNYRSGRYSKILPKRMLGTLEEAARDPSLLEMAAEIQLYDARIADLVTRADSGESSALWLKLRQTYREFQDARRAMDKEQMAIKLGELGDLIDRGHHDFALWNDITELIEKRRRLAETEQKRLVRLKLVLTYDEAVVYANRVLSAVQKFVPDQEVRRRIVDDIRSTTGDNRRLALAQTGVGAID